MNTIEDRVRSVEDAIALSLVVHGVASQTLEGRVLVSSVIEF